MLQPLNFLVLLLVGFGSTNLRVPLSHHLLNNFGDDLGQILCHVRLQLSELVLVGGDGLVDLIEQVLVCHDVLLQQLSLTLLHLK